MSVVEFSNANFAARLFEQLAPFQAIAGADPMALFALCDGVGAMFQPVEDLYTERDDGLSGWANLVDVDTCPDEYLDYLAQFVGMGTRAGFTDAQNRDWIRSVNVFARGRPQTSIDAIKPFLTGTQSIQVRERDGSAWRYTIITKTSETTDEAAIQQILLAHKPGPDILNYEVNEYVDYEWVKDNVATYGDLKTTYTTYDDLLDQEA